MRRRTNWRVTVVNPRKRDGKKWIHLLRGPNSFERRQTSNTSDEAKAWSDARKLEAKLNSQLRASTPGGFDSDPRFLDIFDGYLAQKQATEEGLSENTVECYGSARKALAKAFEEIRNSTLTLAAVLRARDAVKVGRKATTTNLYFGLARTAWNWARSREHVTANWPVFTKLPEEPTDKRPMSVEEQQGVIDFYADRTPFWHGYFELARALGPRSSEQCELKEAENLRRNEVRLHRRPDGTEEAYVLVTFRTKKSRRKASKTREVWVEKRVIDLIPVREEGEWIFPGRNRRRHGKCVSTDAVRDAVGRALVAIGVRDAENVDAHSWRRSGCTDAEDAGVHERRAMEWSAHESNVAHRIYKKRAPKKTFETSVKIKEYREKALAEARASREPSSTGPVASVEDDAPKPRPRRHLDGIHTSCSSAGTDRR